jgi:hypothetical protein
MRFFKEGYLTVVSISEKIPEMELTEMLPNQKLTDGIFC